MRGGGDGRGAGERRRFGGGGVLLRGRALRRRVLGRRFLERGLLGGRCGGLVARRLGGLGGAGRGRGAGGHG
ncbi:hypothetical protein STTU_1830 [Streptomyces sp. Tu6071]|nr:hypothetical protein STTU_1830 [Streptomyces sp. Tu6071]